MASNCWRAFLSVERGASVDDPVVDGEIEPQVPSVNAPDPAAHPIGSIVRGTAAPGRFVNRRYLKDLGFACELSNVYLGPPQNQAKPPSALG